MRAVLWGLLFVTLLITGCTNKNEVEGSVEQISNINHIDDRDDLALHEAVRAKDIETATLLIDANSPVNTKDEYGYTPLHLASIYNQVEIAQQLINNGANVNTQDDYNDTPLIDASRNNYYKMSRLLVCNSAQRNAVDKNGITPLHYASQAKNKEMVELLLSNELEEFCQLNLEITLDVKEETTETSIPFCGTLKEGIASTVSVEVTNAFNEPLETLEANINKYKKSWCTEPSKELALGAYTVKAVAKDKADHTHEVTASFSIVEKVAEVVEEAVTNESEQSITLTQQIYEALMNEFGEDFPKWKATLDPETLILRFDDEQTYFQRGYSQVPQKYKTILADFFPRYITTLEPFQSNIKVLVQGHTSSVFDSVNDEKIKFMKNEILSQKRADKVLSYVKSLESESISKNSAFLENDTKAIAKSSLEVILNEDMSENHLKSRRVDFKVEVLDENSTVEWPVQKVAEELPSETLITEPEMTQPAPEMEAENPELLTTEPTEVELLQ